MSDVRETTGRPSEFNQETADKICELISQGQSVRQICKGSDMPAQSTVYKWLNDFESFSEQYARARESQAEMYAEEIISIADSSTEEAGAVAKARLQVDARKWYASKVAPKKYGDRIQQDINANINVSLIDRVLEARKRARGEDGGGTS
ncbi:helix-turn-helix domain-containing protein [Yokenella regensburgei]|uniref:terminase small subunit-like protein n=1 Tax=Yokenella regensburgei TaxID=158877 RepID=UPI00143343C5|nr:helix-turn-helix domain-containing protein [Yokenella regensburgei]QIU92140.1 helix-turn-helix domain-containing protein [Yokenella regensburgei]